MNYLSVKELKIPNSLIKPKINFEPMPNYKEKILKIKY